MIHPTMISKRKGQPIIGKLLQPALLQPLLLLEKESGSGKRRLIVMMTFKVMTMIAATMVGVATRAKGAKERYRNQQHPTTTTKKRTIAPALVVVVVNQVKVKIVVAKVRLMTTMMMILFKY
jgi:hypothetical protein